MRSLLLSLVLVFPRLSGGSEDGSWTRSIRRGRRWEWGRGEGSNHEDPQPTQSEGIVWYWEEIGKMFKYLNQLSRILLYLHNVKHCQEKIWAERFLEGFVISGIFRCLRLDILDLWLLLLDVDEASNESDDDEYDQGGHNAGGDNEHLLGKWRDAEQDGRLIKHWGGKYG